MLVLVTGASGYLGQWSCRTLREAGHEVRGYARSCPPSLAEADVEWIKGDIAEGIGLEDAVRGCSRVLHLACLPFGASSQDAIEAARVNSLGTTRLLEAARRASVEHVVYASTAFVYGSYTSSSWREAEQPRPDTPYGASKLAGELWCDAYARAYGISVCTLRIFNVYGRAADGGPRPTVETVFIRDIKQGRSPTIKGHSDTARDFVHVSDVMRAFLSAMDATGTYNIGTGIPSSLSEVACLAGSLLGVDVEPNVVVTHDPPTRLVADTRLSAEKLGFRAKMNLRQGLQSLLDS